MAAKSKKKKQIPKKELARETTPHEWLHQIAFWGLALLLFFPPYFRGLFFAPEQEKALVFAALVFWVVFLWRWLQRDYKFLASPLDWFALALPVVYILSSFVAVNKGEAIEEIVKNVLYFLTFWSVSRLVRHEKDAENILKVIYISAAGVALAGLATATGLIYIKDGFLGGRIYSTFQYPNALAAYLGGVLFLGLYLWDQMREKQQEALQSNRSGLVDRLSRSGLWGCLLAGGNFLLLAVLFGTKSRGGLLVFAAVLVIYLAGLGVQRRLLAALHLGYLGALAFIAINKFIPLAIEKQVSAAWLWVIGGVILAAAGQVLMYRAATYLAGDKQSNLAFAALAALGFAAAGAWLFTQPQLIEKITDFNYLRNAIHRFKYTGYALDMILDRPLLGWGGGGWKEAYQAFMDYSFTTREVHSYYFQLGVEAGFLGLAAVAGIWLSFLHLVYRLFRGGQDNPRRRQLVWALAAAFLMIAGHALIDFDLSLSALTLVLWSCFGLALGLYRAQGEDPVPKKQKKYTAPRYLPLGAATAAVIFLLVGCSCLLFSRSLVGQGLALLKSGRAEGVEYLERAARYNPYNAGYNITLSQIYRSLGKHDQALASARRAVQLSRWDLKPRNNLANIAFAAGEYEESAEAASAMLRLAPNNREVYENLAQKLVAIGVKYIESGNPEKARQYFSQALEVPQQMAARWESVSEENKKLWRGARLTMSHPLLLYTGQAKYWLGDFAAAQKALQGAAKNEKLKAEALLYLALVQEKQGRTGQAAKLLQQAQKLDQNVKTKYETLRQLPVLK